ncbi:trypsin-like serine peptidase [Nonomuraea sp. NPDC059194]|uniref:trypsin-like serine peptidase n=1 Tax=Nonomuraea sp. NPDC059194 TaxID=3346764 RepID=UPI003679E4B5
MKRILLPAGGAVLATGLLAAGLAGTAHAAPDVASDSMAKNAAVAKAVAQYWAESNGAALKAATQSNIWDSKDVAKLKSTGGYSADTKPGVVAPIGEEKKTASKSQNVNMPKTIGKVFFVNSKGERKWCSATSIQSRYRNLVSTAGHCVYDTAGNSDVMSKWVFVPGYYQGKAPFGIYVGKQAFTHYDFDVYEDFDRDYAFVTVYNGLKFSTTQGGVKQVSKSEFDAFNGEKDVKLEKITKDEYDAGVSKYGPEGPYTTKTSKGAVNKVGHDYKKPGKDDAYSLQLTGVEVTEYEYKNAPKYTSTKKNGEQCPSWCVINLATGEKGQSAKEFAISEAEYKELVAKKAKGEFPGKVEAKNGGWYKTQYWVKQWVKIDADATDYFKIVGYFIKTPDAFGFADAGRLGDAVGGQGFAYNQPTGKYIRTFGYPAAAHPDGHKNFTGVTPKWCYGKTTAKTVGSAAKKIEEHIALKCSMTEGADGGPWLLKYSNAKRLGYVNGVTSTFNDQDGNDRVDYISSPYFDGETNSVYKAAANVWSGKIAG